MPEFSSGISAVRLDRKLHPLVGAAVHADMYKNYGGVPDPNHDSSNNVDGCYYNYPDSDLNDIVGLNGAMHLYFLENIDRLKRTKQQWDPNNYFNSAQSIPLQS